MHYVKKYIKNYMGKISKNAKLKTVISSKIGKHLRGWIMQEINIIKTKSVNSLKKTRKNIRNPPGYVLAHERGRESQKGYGYEHTNLILENDHRIQHKFDNMGKKNKDRPYDYKLYN